MAANGDLRARYDKEYLVPFGEYFPFGSIELLRRRFGPAREFSAGVGAGILPTAAGPAGILTCNEAMLPEVAAERVAAGAVYLVNPSNDTWIPDEKFSDLQFDIVSLRAIEQRRTLLRVSTSGPSAIVDPYGNVHGRTETFRREVVLGTLRPRDGATIYGRIGDTFAVLCGAAALWGCGGRRSRHSG
jgi:apolipoprotein N-acyltransferase